MNKRLRLIATGLTGCALAACGPTPSDHHKEAVDSAALGAYDQCNAILEGDLFNKISSNTSQTETARTIIWQTLLSMSEDAAYEKYGSYYDMAVRTGGSASVSILGLPVASSARNCEMSVAAAVSASPSCCSRYAPYWSRSVR